MRASCALLALVSLTAMAHAAPRQKADERALVRDYAFAACLIQKHKGSPIAAEAEIWAQGLIERGNIPAGTYVKLAEFAHRHAPEPQSSSTGMPMILASCMQLYNSAALTREIRKLLQKK